MTQHQKFQYRSLEELVKDIERLQLDIPVSRDVGILGREVAIGGRKAPNRLGIHPMEGCDGEPDGNPSELTRRRYRRFARGGAGVLWFEASAVVPEGRANPRQITIHEPAKDGFARLLQDSLSAARAQFGGEYKPYTVLQLTHSGRYSRPTAGPEPIIAASNLYLDPKLPAKYRVITDDELEELEDAYVKAASIAAEIGFDAVDIKSCHGYLIAELLGAHTRTGKYGGSFENRTRFLCNIVDKIQKQLGGGIDVTLRMNAYDAVPYPHGWGVDKNDYHLPDISEPQQLVRLLAQKGVRLINVSVGNPYYNPHVGRPYDTGPYLPPFHPLEGIALLLGVVRDIQAAAGDVPVMGTGFSWLRQWAPFVAAGCVEKGWMQVAGFGRQAFAYPDFAKDILETGGMNTNKVCLACTKCSVIMRDGGRTGCVPRDAEVYAPIYRQGREGKPPAESTTVAEHV